MTSVTGGNHQDHNDPLLTLAKKLTYVFRQGITHERIGDDNVPTVPSAVQAITPSDHPGTQSFPDGLSILTTNGAGTITGGSAPSDIKVAADDTRTWTINLPAGPEALTLGGGMANVNVGPATISAGAGVALVKETGPGDLTFIGGSGAATVLGGDKGATTIFGGSGSLVATGGKHGNDLFITGSGNETLTGGGKDQGGTGHNTFEIIKDQTTNITIRDFGFGDKVEFDGYTALEVSQAHLQSMGGNTTLTLTDNTKIIFVGLDVKSISS